MTRRSWASSLWLAAIAAVFALLVLAVMSWGLTLVAPNLWFDANERARIADDVQHTGDRLQSAHESQTQVANSLVGLVNAVGGYTAAVFDDSGKLIAGDASLQAFRPQGPGLGGPPPSGRASGNAPDLGFRGTLYAMRPPRAHGISFIRPPFFTMSEPASFVRINGATVVFAPTQDALDSIQNLERAISGVVVLLTFIVVLWVSRRMFRATMQPAERLRSGLLRLADGDYARLESFDPDDGDARKLVDAYNAVATEMENTTKQRTEIEARMRQFVADAGHELRTPLAVIMGYVQLLRQGGNTDSEMASRVFSEIDDQGRRISVLIQKLLLLTRLESQEPHDVKILDAADVAANVVESFRPLANGARLSLSAQHDSFVQVSESELYEAIGNLIDNALKYAPGSNIEAKVNATGDSIYVAVKDDGPGMSPEVRARAFERFSRGEMGGSITGSGLGLAIVERAVERAGGSVSLESALGKGTTVSLRFPAWQHVSSN
ncbi:MAG TPA: HAMP domain-containing sensor histidine kinase [Candidatus Acidoferrales bacterium]|nr:HAMP domain-containing sensor histidine kinase [Candidatus Acidoferrales bacterium]